MHFAPWLSSFPGKTSWKAGDGGRFGKSRKPIVRIVGGFLAGPVFHYIINETLQFPVYFSLDEPFLSRIHD
jgi:hypothetical protein